MGQRQGRIAKVKPLKKSDKGEKGFGNWTIGRGRVVTRKEEVKEVGRGRGSSYGTMN